MPRQVLEKHDYTFVGGLNTEAGYLTFPENAWLDADNVIPKIDGSVNRRPRIDFEELWELGPTFTTNQKETWAFSSHVWSNVGGLGNLTFFVVQEGTTVRFYASETSSLSPSIKTFSIDLNTYKVATSPNVFGTSTIETATGNGKLIIVSEDTEPILVEYDLTLDDIDVTPITLYFRDLTGIDDGTVVNVRETPLTVAHNYNLLNQGWDSTKITAYNVSASLYPSNAQVWSQGKDSNNDFSPTELDKMDFGSTLAPRGRFILDIFNRNRDTVSGLTGVTTETEDYRPTHTAFFAGRAWYAGVKSATIGSWVMFSQIVENTTKYGNCYQEGDPTAEYLSDILATDGGIITIPEAGVISKLLPLQESLIIFADNGVWQILGDQSGFKADGYQVKKISSFGCVAAASVVEVENTALYWSYADIFILKRDNISGEFSTSSISANKIQNIYIDISSYGKQYCSGFHNNEEKKVYWLYQNEYLESTVDRFKKTDMLVLDLRLNSFYKLSLANGLPFPVSGAVGSNQRDDELTFEVVAGSDSVLSDTDTVMVSTVIPTSGNKIPKYLTITPATTAIDETDWCLTFSDFEADVDAPEKFMDWYSFDSVGVETTTLPYLITGYQILGDGAKVFQAPYILTYLKRTETGFEELTPSVFTPINVSSCFMQGRWEWTDSTEAGRWTTAREVYRHRREGVGTSIEDTYDNGYPLVVAKSKIRGSGRALSLKFSCSSGKDMQLSGWSIMYNKNTNV